MKNPRAERRLHPKCCPSCGQTSKHIGRRRQNTRYRNDNSNWFISCRPCSQENEEYWAERWADYYSGLL